MSCMVGLVSLPQVAQAGLGSIMLYVMAIFMFVIPCGLMISELNFRMPEEGGFYLWTKKSFGDFHGYLVAWCYWISNVIFLPTILLMISFSILHIFGKEYLVYSDNLWYNAITCLGILWLIILLNIFGLDKAKWIQNIGGVAVWLCITLLLVLGFAFMINGNSDVQFTANDFLPSFADFSLLPFFAAAAFAFGGIELAPVMAGEIKDPRRTIQKGILISSLLAGSLYIVGTFMVIVIAPHGKVGVIDGVAQTFSLVSDRFGAPWLEIVGSVLVLFSALGNFGGWMTGNARIPFVIGLNHYLPAYFAKVHPTWGSPYISLVIQGFVLTILFLVSVAGSTIKEGYLVLYDIAIITYFIPFIYMFASLVWHLARNTGGEGIIPFFQRGRIYVWIVSGLGITITLVSAVIACLPSREIESKGLFVLKVVGGSILLIAAGLPMYYIKSRQAKRANGLIKTQLP